jgi:hypothetical protein
MTDWLILLTYLIAEFPQGAKGVNAPFDSFRKSASKWPEQ